MIEKVKTGFCVSQHDYDKTNCAYVSVFRLIAALILNYLIHLQPKTVDQCHRILLFGGLLIGVGLYAFVDKWQATGSVRVENVYDVILNISLVMVIAGGVVFVVSFAGCVGALRENTCLLKFYSLCLLVFFLLEMGIAIVGFVFPHTLQSLLEESFTDKIIQTYREDPDLQNFIDFGQQKFRCCGLSQEGYLDWGKNEYFNCSSPSVERCGAPFSCCINATDISSGLVNIMCGYKVQMLPVSEAGKKVWTSGCIEIVRSWAERNLYTIAGIALGIALSQLFVIYLAKTLEGQIELQKSRWHS
ncbi:tetraspanin-14-like isoform X1 [Bombus pascuorum]|uniref:tetraspanin-14-like isoform X1 n=1 Tax=Bombus pascuorum TaxID=65598 RepID=UPI002126B2F8|nr:tetraspanin-14-like isoform X1 [Bombus pascuorum]